MRGYYYYPSWKRAIRKKSIERSSILEDARIAFYKAARKGGRLLSSGFYDTQTWNALQKCWLGYTIAKNKGEYDNLIHYASLIQKLEKELGINVSTFECLN